MRRLRWAVVWGGRLSGGLLLQVQQQASVHQAQRSAAQALELQAAPSEAPAHLLQAPRSEAPPHFPWPQLPRPSPPLLPLPPASQQLPLVNRLN